jgi:peptidoglycan/LPS O-acetylase OafA/YrhL
VLRPFDDPELAPLLFAFLVGACAALYAANIELDGRLAAASVLAFFLIARWDGPIEVLGVLPLLYVLLWFGSRVNVPWWNRIGDPSYGVYLYGWPVQALFAEYGLHRALGIHLYILIAIAASTVLGWLSWQLVERHAMRLKQWRPTVFRRSPTREALASN